MASDTPDIAETQEAPTQPPAYGLQRITRELNLPLLDEELATLRAGEWVLVSGTIYLIGARAGRALQEEWDDGAPPALIEPDGSIFFAETSEAPLGKVMGSLAPTTTDHHAMLCCALLDHGIRCIIGSGSIHEDVIERIKKKRGMYLLAMQGTGALAARTVHQAEVVAHESLEQGAIRRVKISRYPCVIALDGFGRYLY